MAEPSSTAALVATTGALTIAGSVLGVPADALVAALMGAALAVSRDPRLTLSRGSILSAISAFGLALSTAIFLGPLLSQLLTLKLSQWLSAAFDPAMVRVACCFLVAFAAHTVWPALVERLRTEIETRGRSSTQ